MKFYWYDTDGEGWVVVAVDDKGGLFFPGESIPVDAHNFHLGPEILPPKTSTITGKALLLVRLDDPDTDAHESKLMRLSETLPGYKYYKVAGQRIFPYISGSGGLSSRRIAYLCKDDVTEKDFDSVDLDAPDYIL